MKWLFGPLFDAIIGMYKKVMSLRKDDSPGQELALFIFLLLVTIGVLYAGWMVGAEMLAGKP